MNDTTATALITGASGGIGYELAKLFAKGGHNLVLVARSGPKLERRSGKIMNVASTAGFQPGPRMAVYYATKAYVISFSEALANELAGQGVTMTCLCPGATATDFASRAGNARSRLFKQLGPMDAKTVALKGYRGLMA